MLMNLTAAIFVTAIQAQKTNFYNFVEILNESFLILCGLMLACISDLS